MRPERTPASRLVSADSRAKEMRAVRTDTEILDRLCMVLETCGGAGRGKRPGRHCTSFPRGRAFESNTRSHQAGRRIEHVEMKYSVLDFTKRASHARSRRELHVEDYASIVSE